MLLISILIRLDSRGPVLYTPRMLGHHGAPFLLLRFRTMALDAPDHAPPQERFTRVGRVIRNLSLDHLPTLLNLLNGTLTLIGPRPMEPEHVDLQDPAWQRYFQIKPGLLNYAVLQLGQTWTPTQRRDPAVNRDLELAYIEKQSFLFDLRLFCAWMRALVTSRGNVKARGAAQVAGERKSDGDDQPS